MQTSWVAAGESKEFMAPVVFPSLEFLLSYTHWRLTQVLPMCATVPIAQCWFSVHLQWELRRKITDRFTHMYRHSCVLFLCEETERKDYFQLFCPFNCPDCVFRMAVPLIFCDSHCAYYCTRSSSGTTHVHITAQPFYLSRLCGRSYRHEMYRDIFAKYHRGISWYLYGTCISWYFLAISCRNHQHL